MGIAGLETLLGYSLQPRKPVVALAVLASGLFGLHLALQFALVNRRKLNFVDAARFTWVEIGYFPWKMRGDIQLPATPWLARTIYVAVYGASALATILLAAALVGLAQAVPAGKQIIDAFG
jgi:hypothetical protein